MYNLKLKAFTIVELLVIVTITALLLGLVIGVLSMVQQQFVTMQKSYRLYEDWFLLEKRLYRDFAYSVIELEGNTLRVDKTLLVDEYQILSDKVVLNRRDTLDVKIVSFKGYSDRVLQLEGRIEALQLEIEIGGKIVKSFLNTYHDSKYYME